MTKSTITREQLLEIIETDHVQCGEASYLASMALAAMDSEPVELPLDYLQGHKDGLEWAARLAEANHPDTGDWLYDDPIELAKAIRKGPDMPPVQPVADSEPVAYMTYKGYLLHAGDPKLAEYSDPIPLYADPRPEPTSAEPVAWLLSGGGTKNVVCFDSGNAYADPLREVTPLYRHAQPAPVVPEDFDFNRFNDVVWLECVASNPHMHSPTTSAIARVALELNKRSATMEAEPDRNPVLAYADSYRDMAKQGVDSVPIWSVITDLERNIAPLYRHAQPASEREQVRRQHAEWSQATFGNVGPVGQLKHLSKEALEAAEQPGDLSEWADMQFLLWDAQRRAGITDDQITQAMIEKLAVNKQREWPEPKDGEPRLHIKEQPAPVAQCPYPCGWDTLNKLAIQDAAFVALALVAGEPVTESIRQAAITNSDRLLKVISACRAAMLAAAPQEVKDGK